MADDDSKPTTDTFTRADVRRMIGAEVAKVREQFADYDDLKTRAAEADKSKSQLDRIESQLAEQVKRADQAERETLIRDVAEHFGVSVKVARKFEGKTKSEMIADGVETLTDMGIEPDKGKRTTAPGKAVERNQADADSGGQDDDSDNGNGHDDDAGDDSGNGDDSREQTTTNRPAPTRRGRPTERLRSGAPGASGNGPGAEGLTPEQLAAKIRI